MKAIRAVLVTMLVLGGCGSCQREEGAGKTKAPTAAQPASAPAQGQAQPTAGAGSQPGAAAQAGGAATSKTPGVPPVDEGDCVVVADVDNDFGPPPLTVKFTAEAECEHGPPTFKWTFGDDSPPSTEPNPSHTYTKVGDYVATVTVTGPDAALSVDEIDIFVEQE